MATTLTPQPGGWLTPGSNTGSTEGQARFSNALQGNHARMTQPHMTDASATAMASSSMPTNKARLSAGQNAATSLTSGTTVVGGSSSSSVAAAAASATTQHSINARRGVSTSDLRSAAARPAAGTRMGLATERERSVLMRTVSHLRKDEKSPRPETHRFGDEVIGQIDEETIDASMMARPFHHSEMASPPSYRPQPRSRLSLDIRGRNRAFSSSEGNNKNSPYGSAGSRAWLSSANLGSNDNRSRSQLDLSTAPATPHTVAQEVQQQQMAPSSYLGFLEQTKARLRNNNAANKLRSISISQLGARKVDNRKSSSTSLNGAKKRSTPIVKQLVFEEAAPLDSSSSLPMDRDQVGGTPSSAAILRTPASLASDEAQNCIVSIRQSTLDSTSGSSSSVITHPSEHSSSSSSSVRSMQEAALQAGHGRSSANSSQDADTNDEEGLFDETSASVSPHSVSLQGRGFSSSMSSVSTPDAQAWATPMELSPVVEAPIASLSAGQSAELNKISSNKGFDAYAPPHASITDSPARATESEENGSKLNAKGKMHAFRAREGIQQQEEQEQEQQQQQPVNPHIPTSETTAEDPGHCSTLAEEAQPSQATTLHPSTIAAHHHNRTTSDTPFSSPFISAKATDPSRTRVIGSSAGPQSSSSSPSPFTQPEFDALRSPSNTQSPLASLEASAISAQHSGARQDAERLHHRTDALGSPTNPSPAQPDHIHFIGGEAREAVPDPLPSSSRKVAPQLQKDRTPSISFDLSRANRILSGSSRNSSNEEGAEEQYTEAYNPSTSSSTPSSTEHHMSSLIDRRRRSSRSGLMAAGEAATGPADSTISLEGPASRRKASFGLGIGMLRQSSHQSNLDEHISTQRRGSAADVRGARRPSAGSQIKAILLGRRGSQPNGELTSPSEANLSSSPGSTSTRRISATFLRRPSQDTKSSALPFKFGIRRGSEGLQTATVDADFAFAAPTTMTPLARPSHTASSSSGSAAEIVPSEDPPQYYIEEEPNSASSDEQDVAAAERELAGVFGRPQAGELSVPHSGDVSPERLAERLNGKRTSRPPRPVSQASTVNTFFSAANSPAGATMALPTTVEQSNDLYTSAGSEVGPMDESRPPALSSSPFTAQQATASADDSVNTADSGLVNAITRTVWTDSFAADLRPSSLHSASQSEHDSNATSHTQITVPFSPLHAQAPIANNISSKADGASSNAVSAIQHESNQESSPRDSILPIDNSLPSSVDASASADSAPERTARASEVSPEASDATNGGRPPRRTAHSSRLSHLPRLNSTRDTRSAGNSRAPDGSAGATGGDDGRDGSDEGHRGGAPSDDDTLDEDGHDDGETETDTDTDDASLESDEDVSGMPGSMPSPEIARRGSAAAPRVSGDGGGRNDRPSGLTLPPAPVFSQYGSSSTTTDAPQASVVSPSAIIGRQSWTQFGSGSPFETPGRFSTPIATMGASDATRGPSSSTAAEQTPRTVTADPRTATAENSAETSYFNIKPAPAQNAAQGRAANNMPPPSPSIITRSRAPSSASLRSLRPNTRGLVSPRDQLPPFPPVTPLVLRTSGRGTSPQPPRVSSPVAMTPAVASTIGAGLLSPNGRKASVAGKRASTLGSGLVGPSPLDANEVASALGGLALTPATANQTDDAASMAHSGSGKRPSTSSSSVVSPTAASANEALRSPLEASDRAMGQGQLRPGLYKQHTRSLIDLNSSMRKQLEPSLSPIQTEFESTNRREISPHPLKLEDHAIDPSIPPPPMSPTTPGLRRRRSMYEVGASAPPYSVIHRRADGRQEIYPREEEGSESLPAYKCSVHIEGYLPRKMEFSAPGLQAKDRSWRRQYFVLHGTCLRVYRTDLSGERAAVKGDFGPLDGAHVHLEPMNEDGPTMSTTSSFNTGQGQINGHGEKGAENASFTSSHSNNPSIQASTNSSHKSGNSVGAAVEAALSGTISHINHPFSHRGSLVKQYTLQGAESGLAADYLKRRHVVRVRAEGEQFLLQTRNDRHVVDWIEAFQAATNVALDLERRPMPKFITLPRRRRRRRRDASATPGAAHVNSNGTAGGGEVSAREAADIAEAQRRSLSEAGRRSMSGTGHRANPPRPLGLPGDETPDPSAAFEEMLREEHDQMSRQDAGDL